MVLTTTCSAVEIIAHRGASYDAPENTLAAFELAWEQGADEIESDFHLTSDGKIITIHDPSTKQTTGVDWKVAEHTLDELRTLDAGVWKGPQWKGQKLPTLDEVLAMARPGKGFRLEIKCGPEILPEFKRVLAASGVKPEQVTVISFKEQVIEAVRKQLPDLHAVWLFAFEKDKETGEWNRTPQEVVETARRIGAHGVSLSYKHGIDENLVALLRQAKLEFHVWTVDDPEIARRMVDLGALSVTTDRPAFIRQALAEAATDSFDQLYRLEEGQVIKFIPPRETEARRLKSPDSGPTDRFRAYFWTGDRIDPRRHMRFDRVLLPVILQGPLGLKPEEYRVAEKLNIVSLNGDWIVRADAPTAERIASLEAILRDRFKMPVRFEKRGEVWHALVKP